jgi:hypothetical protein
MLLGMKSHFSLIGFHYAAQRLCHSKELLPESVCSVVTRRYFVVCQQIGKKTNSKEFSFSSWVAPVVLGALRWDSHERTVVI